MSALIIVGGVVALVGVAIFVKLARDRRSTSIEASMREFRRGLDALDPANDPLQRARDGGRTGRRNGSGHGGNAGPGGSDPGSGDDGRGQGR
jgi:hypothetical protein